VFGALQLFACQFQLADGAIPFVDPLAHCSGTSFVVSATFGIPTSSIAAAPLPLRATLVQRELCQGNSSLTERPSAAVARKIADVAAAQQPLDRRQPL